MTRALAIALPVSLALWFLIAWGISTAFGFPHCGEHSCVRDGSSRVAPERQIYCHNPVAHDGDTLACGAIRIRLQGVDAPELSQKGGKEAKVALSVTWLETDAIVCYPASTDKYGRLIAMCRGQYIPDIAAWLVRHGHAWDYPAYSRGHYADLESMARADKLGIWKGPDDPVPPWQYRRDRK